MKKTTLTDCRIIVEPDSRYMITKDEGKLRSSLCDDLLREIKRHVDGIGSVYKEDVYEHTCEHCESKWTEVSPKYNGGCCDEDEKNNPEAATEAA